MSLLQTIDPTRLGTPVPAKPEPDRMIAGNPTVSQGRVILRIKPWGERNRTQQEIGRSIAPQIVAVPGVVGFPSNPPSLGQSSRSKPINFVIQTSDSYENLSRVTRQFLDEMEKRA